jgi:tryptophan synthase beta chain
MNVGTFQVSEKGFYGSFGGAYIPEMLYPNIEELRSTYREIIQETAFQEQFHQLLRDYVGRPTPLYFAERLSNRYNCQLYLKREDLCHTGAHKINNTIGQILLAGYLGKQHIIAETGAGQHGVATATVCALKGLKCTIFMGATDVQRQRPNVERMKMLGAEIISVQSGSKTLKDATNEAMRFWIAHPEECHYIIGSVVGPHPYPDMVSRFQAIISDEIRVQLQEKTGRPYPDHVIACIGGGSNAAGAFYHFLEAPDVKLWGIEAAGLGVDTSETAATISRGSAGILHGSKTLLMQTSDGQVIEPYSISAGLDYPGIGPLHAHLAETGRVQFKAITDQQAMKAGFLCSEEEGIIPAIETAHALAALEEIALDSNEVVVLNLSGRGDKDLSTYIKYKENE